MTLLLEDNIDISRGDMIVKSGDMVRVMKEYEVDICWLGEQLFDLKRRYVIKHTTKTVRALITRIDYRVDITTLQLAEGISELHMNDIAHVSIKVQQPLVVDSYSRNRATGNFIVIDEATNNTVAAGMIV